MNVTCSAEPCPVILNATCVFYQGENLIYTGINTNDNLQTALEKIDAKFQDSSIGYIFDNGVIQTAPGQPVRLGGSLMQNTVISSGGYTFEITGSIKSGAFITTGGTFSQFVKGDGSLDSTSYQPAGNYITALTGDGVATGPGSATLILANVNLLPGTYGGSSSVPVITVNSKGLATTVSSTPISFPAGQLLFSGDVSGSGFTGTITTLTLGTVNPNIYGTNTALKFAVNGKGLVTSAAPLTNLDIFSIIGFTPVPNTRTITINGVTQNLSANRSWTVDTLPSQTGNSGKYLTTNGTVASWGVIDLSAYQPLLNGTGFVKMSGTTVSYDNSTYYLASNPNNYTSNLGTVTSVGLTMPNAFSVANSPVTTSGTLAVTANGFASQYIRGDGQLATLPSSPSGGGASISYYLNGSVPASVATYEQMSKTPVFGTGTNFTTSSNGLIAQFLTDVGDPSLINIPGGAWLIDLYFNVDSAGGTPNFYIELYTYDGVTFTLIASNVSNPEYITNGTSVDFYTTSLAVPTTPLTLTDRLAIRVYVDCSGKTLTLHTEDDNLAEVVTTFSTGISALNGLTAQVQFLATGVTGTDFNINSTTATHTFNLPTASASNRGALSSTDWTTFNGKFTLPSLTNGSVLFSNGTTIAQDNANLFWDDTNNRLGIGTNIPSAKLNLDLDITTTNIGFSITKTGVTSTDANFQISNATGTTGQFLPSFNVTSNYSFSSSTIGGVFGSRITNSNASDIGWLFETRTKSSAPLTQGWLFSFRNYATDYMRIAYNGNMILQNGGTFTDSGYKLDVSGTARIQGALTLKTSANSNYQFNSSVYTNRIGLQQLVFADTFFDLYPQVATGGKDIGFVVWAKGIPGNITNSELLEFRYDNTNSRFALDILQTGTGSLRPFHLYIGTNTNQLKLQTNGNVSINSASDNASAQLQIDSTTKGFLPPRMNLTQRLAISSPAIGLVVYQTDTTEGLYQYSSTGWQLVGSGGGTGGSAVALFNYYNFI